MRSRHLAALVLSAFLAAAAHSQAPKDPPKEKEKEKDKETRGPTKLTEPLYPTSMGGKDLAGWLKDVNHPDPAVREFSLKTLLAFNPLDVRKAGGKLLLARMSAEKDPGVRITVFNTVAMVGFIDATDEREAVRQLGLTADTGVPGGLGRLHAIQTLGIIGSKSEGAIHLIAGLAISDPAYETRRSIATTLGKIAFNETNGPNQVALNKLSGILAHDVSAAVRMEALQSLVILGPPWAAGLKAAPKAPPVINQKGADYVADSMRVRLGLPAGGAGAPVGVAKLKLLEEDKQLEIWCRVVLMRFDPKEINLVNMTAIANHLQSPELGPKIQALQALAMFGEEAAAKVDAVVKLLDENDTLVLTSALTALGSMGVKAQGAIPALEAMEKKWGMKRDERKKEEQIKKLLANYKTDKEREQLIAQLDEEQLRLAATSTIKWLKDSKPGMPGGDRKEPAPAPGEVKKP